MGQLDADWLSVEFAAAEAEIASWSEGLRASLVEREPIDPSEESNTFRDAIHERVS